MRKISDYIFDFSPKKLTIYLVLVPIILLLIHTSATIAFRNVSVTSTILETFLSIIFIILGLCLTILVFLWLFWLHRTVFSIDEHLLGIPRKWFLFAYVMLIVFILFNITATIIDTLAETQTWIEDYMFLIYSSREFINFTGIMVAYPIICHYAARAATVKRSKQPATLINSIPFTLLLLFGGFLGIPFLHGYFSTKSSPNSQIMIVYSIAFGLCIILFIVAFIASITGLI